jgi:hypothetical protein
MKRLWPDLKGLRLRRDREAALFEMGLKAAPPPPDIEPVSPAKPEVVILKEKPTGWVAIIEAITSVFKKG